MIYLLLTIFSSTSIYIIFKHAKNYSCQLTDLITINYLTATLLGFVFFVQFNNGLISQIKSWYIFAILTGFLFIVMFFLIGNSSQKAGITVTTLANKLSLVFPVLFSLIYFEEQITPLKFIGIISGVVAVFLAIYKTDIKKTKLIYLLLPVFIFAGSGITDSVVKYVQAVKIDQTESALFSTIVFFIAFVISLLISVIRKKAVFVSINSPTLILGTLLGVVNFGSLYFLIDALNKSNLKSSLVFAVVNMSIVILSALAGRLLFNEKLSKINTAGIILAIFSIYILL
jgi:drug/metabolite transporter (DMT)-like permease